MDFDFLKEVRMVQFTNLVTLQLANNPAQADQVSSLEGYVEKLDAEIKRRKEEDEKGQKPNISTEVSTAKDYTSHKIKSMCNVIATEIPVFSSGHDVHTSSLLGVSKVLASTKDEWEGTVKLIFQPGESRQTENICFMASLWF